LTGPAALADHRLDPALLQLLAERGAVVAAVGPELGREQTAREQVVDQRQQLQPLVLVPGPDADREGRPDGVDG
jgi:hypothetical protein